MPALSDPARQDMAQALGSLAGLALLKAVMLAALFTRTPPFPPPFLAPLIGATLAIAALAAVLAAARSPRFFWPASAFAAASLLSFGPQKLLPGTDPRFFAVDPATWPAVVVGSLLILMLVRASLRLRRHLAEG